MGSSLNNCDPSYQDSMELEYPPFDVYCKYAETISNKGQLNMHQTSCNTKLAMEEIPSSCMRCKGIKPKPSIKNQSLCDCGKCKACKQNKIDEIVEKVKTKRSKANYGNN